MRSILLKKGRKNRMFFQNVNAIKDKVYGNVTG